MSPVEEKRRFVASMPNAVCEIIANSGHGTPFDQTRKLNALVLEFLNGLAESAAERSGPRVQGAPVAGVSASLAGAAADSSP